MYKLVIRNGITVTNSGKCVKDEKNIAVENHPGQNFNRIESERIASSSDYLHCPKYKIIIRNGNEIENNGRSSKDVGKKVNEIPNDSNKSKDIEKEVNEVPNDASSSKNVEKEVVVKNFELKQTSSVYLEAKCPKCSIPISNQQNLKRHIKNVHETSNANRKWVCQNCSCNFYKAQDLKKHIENSHKKKVITAELMFNNYKDFLVWKEKEEEDTFSFFSKINSVQKNNSLYERFECNFHGSNRKHDKNPKGIRIRKKGSCKSNRLCMASIIVYSNVNGTRVNYCKSHSHPLKFENTKYHPIPDSIKEKAEELLLLGVPIDMVHKKLTEEQFLVQNRGGGKLTKKDAVKMKDIVNISERLKKQKRMSQDDITNTNLIVHKWNNEMPSRILLYKNQAEIEIGPTDIFQHVSPEAFILGYQTDAQRKKLENATDRMLFIDATHGTNVDGHQMLNVLVKDKNKKGYPVAFFLVSDMTEPTISACLRSIRIRSPGFQPLLVMTDDDAALYKAVREVYGEDVICLLCSWHVKRSWKRKLRSLVKDKDLRELILSTLEDILHEKNVSACNKKVRHFRRTFKQYPKVVNYLKKHYFTSERMKRWAYCMRTLPHCDTEVNMTCESFHSVLKRKFLKRRAKRRLDDLLLVLEAVEVYYYQRSIQVFMEIEEEEEEETTEDDTEEEEAEVFMEIDEEEEETIEEDTEAEETDSNEEDYSNGSNVLNDDNLIEKHEDENAAKGDDASDTNVNFEMHRGRKKWGKIAGYLSNLQAYLFDQDLISIIDHLEGTLGNLVTVCEDTKGIINTTQYMPRRKPKTPPNEKLKKQNVRF